MTWASLKNSFSWCHADGAGTLKIKDICYYLAITIIPGHSLKQHIFPRVPVLGRIARQVHKMRASHRSQHGQSDFWSVERERAKMTYGCPRSAQDCTMFVSSADSQIIVLFTISNGRHCKGRFHFEPYFASFVATVKRRTLFYMEGFQVLR